MFSVKKGVLRNFTKFTGKQRCFHVNFVKILRTPFLQNMAIDGEMLYLKGPSLGSDLFSDKAYHKNKYLCKISFSNGN